MCKICNSLFYANLSTFVLKVLKFTKKKLNNLELKKFTSKFEFQKPLKHKISFEDKFATKLFSQWFFHPKSSTNSNSVYFFTKPHFIHLKFPFIHYFLYQASIQLEVDYVRGRILLTWMSIHFSPSHGVVRGKLIHFPTN